MKGMFKGLAITLTVFAFGCIMFQSKAQATAAFARKYSLSCNTCHSITFPRLNFYGERFMRNGFQLPGGQEGSTMGKKGIADDLSLAKHLGNFVAVRGKIRVFEDQQNDSLGNNIPSTIGSTIFGAFFASGTVAKNMPFWAEFETNTANGETELHNFFVGWTNVNGNSMANFRVGGFTPTEWTSFSDQKRGLDGPTSHPGAFRPGKYSKSGSDPYNLRTTTGLEYYGYNGPAFWAVGVADKMGGDYHTDHAANSIKDVYFVLRGEAPSGPVEGSSVSLLAYHANNGALKRFEGTSDGEYTVYDISANLRKDPLDLQFAYVTDVNRIQGNGTSNDQGITFEGDVKLRTGLLGILRYDTFDDGSITSGDSRTTTVTPALVYAPRQNCKVTASYTIDASDNTTGDFGERSNTFDIETQFMF